MNKILLVLFIIGIYFQEYSFVRSKSLERITILKTIANCNEKFNKGILKKMINTV
jgi:hypothetical protein